MRLSIWQQFASNHSTDFRIVGTFQTAQAAQAAAAELHRVMERIITWWRENKSDEYHWGDHWLTPIEQELAAQYGIDWSTESLVWDYENRDIQIAASYQFVFVESPFEALLGPQPFTGMLQSIGSTVVTDGPGYSGILINLSFTAPDQHTGQIILQAWQSSMTGPRIQDVPWLPYHGGKLHSRASELLEMAKPKTYRFDENKIYREFKYAQERRDAEKITEIKRQYEANNRTDITFEDYIWAFESIDTAGNFSDGGLHQPPILFEQSGLNCHVGEFTFAGDYAPTFVSLTAWLEDQGCTDLVFTFTEY